jgi:hypothetical protein
MDSVHRPRPSETEGGGREKTPGKTFRAGSLQVGTMSDEKMMTDRISLSQDEKFPFGFAENYSLPVSNHAAGR